MKKTFCMTEQRSYKILWCLVLLLVLTTFSACSYSSPDPGSSVAPGHLRIHFIDVGQADSILVQTSRAAFLIDGGNNDDGLLVVDYLKKQGVKELAGMIGTHPHEDHIGGLDTVLQAIPVKNVYMPNITHTSKTFADFVAAVKSSGAKRIQVRSGVKVDWEDLQGDFLGPVGTYDGDLNNNSAVWKLTFGDTVFLFTGDIERAAEADLVKNEYLKADVLKVAHHGSDTSSTQEFLQAVAPKYAVISCGAGNPYGHPSAQTLERLSQVGADIYRTDEYGTVVLESDGSKITVLASLSTAAHPVSAGRQPGQKAGSMTVYITATGAKYHLEGCSSLGSSKKPLSLEEAKKSYTPCSKCNPPQ